MQEKNEEPNKEFICYEPTAEDVTFPDEHPLKQLELPSRTMFGKWVDTVLNLTNRTEYMSGKKYF